jgi:hypothetical protein
MYEIWLTQQMHLTVSGHPVIGNLNTTWPDSGFSLEFETIA